LKFSRQKNNPNPDAGGIFGVCFAGPPQGDQIS
jgi:hypothetical protein